MPRYTLRIDAVVSAETRGGAWEELARFLGAYSVPETRGTARQAVPSVLDVSLNTVLERPDELREPWKPSRDVLPQQP